MKTNDARIKFISILNELKNTKYEYIKKWRGYELIKTALTNESTMSHYFHKLVNDIYHAKDSIEGKVIIDAGCGAGDLSVLLALLGAKKVYAVDLLDDNIKMAKLLINIANLDNVAAIHSNICELKLREKTIDAVFSIEAISHYKNHELFLEMASKVLKGG